MLWWQLWTHLGLLSISPLVVALKSPHVTPTTKVVDEFWDDSVRFPQPTEPPAFNQKSKRALLARQASRTCGYFNGDADLPNTCGPNSQCLFGADSHYFGCNALNTTDYTTITACFTWDGIGTNTGAEFVTSGTNNVAVSCGESVSECRTTYFPSVGGLSGNTGPYTHYDCVATAGPILYLMQSPTTQVTLAGGSVSISTVTFIPTASTPEPTTTTGSTSSTTASADSGLSSGAQAGIGVGVSLGVIAVIAVGALFWWRRKRSQRSLKEAPAQEYSDKAELPADSQQASGYQQGGQAAGVREYYKPAPTDEASARAELEGGQQDHESGKPAQQQEDQNVVRAELESDWRGWEAPTS